MTALALLAIGACTGHRDIELRTTNRGATIATFVGEIDAATGAVTVTPIPAADGEALSYWTRFQEIPINNNGIWDDAQEGQTEMRTVAILGDVGLCGTVPRWDAVIEIHSGYYATRLENAYVEILSLTPAGTATGPFETCLSEPSPDPGNVGDRLGLFWYGTIEPRGYSRGTWSFKDPGGSFRFAGRLVAQPVETTPPVTTATYADSTVTLACTDGGSGCADTYYNIDGDTAVSTSPYTGPISLTGAAGPHRICYYSQDIAGNQETAHCLDLSISSSSLVGSWVDLGAVTVPSLGSVQRGAVQCASVASTCDTGPTLIRGATAASEPHSPNTVDGCNDGQALTGQYGVDESIDRLVLSTDDGGPIAPGKVVTLSATMQAPYADDFFHAFYTTKVDGANTVWRLVPGLTMAGLAVHNTAPSRPSVATLHFRLPAGAVAIRGHLGWGALPSITCRRDGADDYDDLIFTPLVDPAGSASPAVSMTAPVAGSTISRTVLLRADASDDGRVTQVAFSWKPSGTSGWNAIAVDPSRPWAVAWDTRVASGAIDLRAVATDNDGNVTSTTTTVTVEDRTPPAVAFTAPAAGGDYARDSALTLSATSSDERGIATVTWYVDGVQVASAGPGASGTFTAIWDTSSLATFAAGAHTAWVRATDEAGNVAQAKPITVTLH